MVYGTHTEFGDLSVWKFDLPQLHQQISLFFYPRPPTCVKLCKDKDIYPRVGVSIEGREISLDVEDDLS